MSKRKEQPLSPLTKRNRERGCTLFICYKNPLEGIAGGGELGSGSNLKILQKIVGEENVCQYYIHPYLPKRFAPLKLLNILVQFLRNYYYGLSPHRVGQLVKMAHGFDSVFIDRSIFGIVAKELRKSNYEGTIISFFHNVEPIYFAAKIGRKPWRSIVTRCVQQNEQWACQYSNYIVALNQRDNKEIERLYHRSADFLTPVALEDQLHTTPTEELTSTKPRCLFIGSYFPMNSDGIRWFIREVFPYISIHLQIIGKGMEALAGSFPAHPDIELLGSVESLLPYYEQADFMILPIFSGSGMKVKTCEGLMYGKNILGTTEAFEGYELDFNRAGGLCNTRQEYIDTLTKYMAQPCRRFNSYNRMVYTTHYSYESREQVFRSLLGIEN